jgi:hypothetical protein
MKEICPSHLMQREGFSFSTIIERSFLQLPQPKKIQEESCGIAGNKAGTVPDSTPASENPTGRGISISPIHSGMKTQIATIIDHRDTPDDRCPGDLPARLTGLKTLAITRKAGSLLRLAGPGIPDIVPAVPENQEASRTATDDLNSTAG